MIPLASCYRFIASQWSQFYWKLWMTLASTIALPLLPCFSWRRSMNLDFEFKTKTSYICWFLINANQELHGVCVGRQRDCQRFEPVICCCRSFWNLSSWMKFRKWQCRSAAVLLRVNMDLIVYGVSSIQKSINKFIITKTLGHCMFFIWLHHRGTQRATKNAQFFWRTAGGTYCCRRGINGHNIDAEKNVSHVRFSIFFFFFAVKYVCQTAV